MNHSAIEIHTHFLNYQVESQTLITLDDNLDEISDAHQFEDIDLEIPLSPLQTNISDQKLIIAICNNPEGEGPFITIDEISGVEELNIRGERVKTFKYTL